MYLGYTSHIQTGRLLSYQLTVSQQISLKSSDSSISTVTRPSGLYLPLHQKSATPELPGLVQSLGDFFSELIGEKKLTSRTKAKGNSSRQFP